MDYSMTTPENVLYASTARPWLKYYAQKYIVQTLPRNALGKLLRK